MKIVFKIVLAWSLATQLATLQPAYAADLLAPASPESPFGPAAESRPSAAPAADPVSPPVAPPVAP
ncbi:MAG TPA: hypothetical protein PLW65_16350, partial [Pseudomonadota bacterium]|nr:hypothetical protein [Pseudomonadota bacterium]